MKTPPSHPSQLDMVIFGGLGDLAMRKLLPALFMALRHKNLPEDSRIILTGRQPLEKTAFFCLVNEKSGPFSLHDEIDKALWETFLRSLVYCPLDVTRSEDYHRLKEVLRSTSRRVYYLSTAPGLFVPIGEHLATQKLITPDCRIVLEKPLGHDANSSQAINDAIGRHFSEPQIYRIDHYLGKETVQNLMVLRFGNAIFEPLWRNSYIRNVQITVAEDVGVGSRAGFYDGTGAMRDMVQNHLLQLLCIVAMEPPVSLDANAVRDEKLKVLKSLRSISPSEIATHAVRGQYTPGTVQGQQVRGYLQEQDIPPSSATETFVALRVHVDNWRWANVPFFLRTGKRMPRKVSEIVVEFDPLPFSIFPSLAAQPLANRLHITLQPEESVKLHMMAKEPGSGMRLKPVGLNLDLQSALQGRRSEAYERLLLDVVHGRLTHFMRRDELDAAWRWVDPIIGAWNAAGEPPRPYTAGTWGPAASSALMARSNAHWMEEA